VYRRWPATIGGAASDLVPPVDPQQLNAAGSVYLTRASATRKCAVRSNWS